MTGWIGISLGDATGVGPEVALKAVAAEAANDETKYLFIGDENCLRRLNRKFGPNLALETFSGYNAAGKFFTANPLAEPLPENLPAGSPVAARAAIAWLRDGAERCLRRRTRRARHRAGQQGIHRPRRAQISSGRPNFSPNSPAPNAPR